MKSYEPAERDDDEKQGKRQKKDPNAQRTQRVRTYSPPYEKELQLPADLLPQK